MAKERVTSAPAAQAEKSSAANSLVLSGKDGKTTIQPHVVAKIAGLAVREVAGVHMLVPVSTGQTLTNIAQRISGNEMRDLGVNVEVGQVEAAVDVRIVTSYGVSIPEIAAGIRQNVGDRINSMTGLIVKEVNIEVVDLYFAEEETQAVPSDSRRVA